MNWRWWLVFLSCQLPGLLIIFVLAGCASVPTQTVVSHAEALPPQKIAVSVLCAKLADVKPIPATLMDPKAAYTEQLLALAEADIDNLKIWGNDLYATAVGCAGDLKPEAKP